MSEKAIWVIHQNVDLLRGFVDVNVWQEALMLPGDDAAHLWEVEIKSGGQPVDLTGCTAIVFFERSDKERSSVVLDCTISGNTVSVTFEPECYAIPGQLRGILRVTSASGSILTACETYFRVRNPPSGTIVDPGNIVPNVDVLMTKLQQLVTATDAAISAATNANEAADRANSAADKLNWDFIVSDDGAGHVTLSGLVDVMDDGKGNVSIGPFASSL